MGLIDRFNKFIYGEKNKHHVGKITKDGDRIAGPRNKKCSDYSPSSQGGHDWELIESGNYVSRNWHPDEKYPYEIYKCSKCGEEKEEGGFTWG